MGAPFTGLAAGCYALRKKKQQAITAQAITAATPVTNGFPRFFSFPACSRYMVSRSTPDVAITDLSV
ncbi:hypothetical protein FACS1894181_01530 [Bacteroidia bacterium]|nr:hypothetical protein FACS1894181_01530 [Bacteroidia bacterium]